jgi:hypothetical protein
MPSVERECMFWEDSLSQQGRFDRLRRAELLQEAARAREEAAARRMWWNLFRPKQKWARVARAVEPAGEEYRAALRAAAPKQALSLSLRSVDDDALATISREVDLELQATEQLHHHHHTRQVQVQEGVWLDGLGSDYNSKASSQMKEALAAAGMENSEAYNFPNFTEEMWVCGGTESVVIVLRVVEDKALNPRGIGLVEVIGGEFASHARTNFNSLRPLCENDKKKFAISECKSGSSRSRKLSESALKALRVYMPGKELCLQQGLMEQLWRACLPEGRYRASTAVNAVVRMQSVARRFLVKMKISELKNS